MLSKDDLIKDRDGLLAQANHIQGALSYVTQRLAMLDKAEAEAEREKNGKAEDTHPPKVELMNV